MHTNETLPAAPWLPEPPPRPASTPRAMTPLQPVVPVATAARQARRRRRRGQRVAVLLILAAAGGFWALRQHELGSSDGASPEHTGSSNGSLVTTDAMRFVMPEEPEVEPLDTEVLGVKVQGTAWTVDHDDWMVQVIGIDFGTPLTDATAQSSFDGELGGMARGGNGELVVDEASVEAGVSRRHAVIRLEDAWVFVELYAKGSRSVALTAAGTDREPPAEFDALVDSFRFV